MALADFLLFIDGIRGDLTDRLDAIEVHAWSYGLRLPRDAASGQPTGRRAHDQVVISKPIDKSSPTLLGIAVNNGVMKTARLELHRMDKGKSVKYFEIQLKNATISSIQTKSTGPNLPPAETVAFVFKSITWTHIESGTTAEDSWEGSVST